CRRVAPAISSSRPLSTTIPGVGRGERRHSRAAVNRSAATALPGYNDAFVTDQSRAPEPADAVAAAVYDELRRLAHAYMRRERPGQTLQATALVNEAYLRLADAGTQWNDRQ